jgi:hypothetical protein
MRQRCLCNIVKQFQVVGEGGTSGLDSTKPEDPRSVKVSKRPISTQNRVFGYAALRKTQHEAQEPWSHDVAQDLAEK